MRVKCVICKNEYNATWPLKALFFSRTPLINQCCSGCQKAFKRINLEESCRCCSGRVIAREEVCHDCKEWATFYPKMEMRHQGLYHYNEGMGDYFQRYKFQGDIQMSRAFCLSLHDGLLKEKKGLVVPIPISKSRRKERGFNQVEELLDQSHIPYVPVLKKRRGFSSQGSKNKEERLDMAQCFYIDSKFRTKIKGADIVLVDDVYTTGRTMYHAYECLMREKPNSIKSYSLAR